MIRVLEGQLAKIQIPVLDFDVTNDIRCRWASNAGVLGDECADVCENLPGANISQSVYT